MNIIKESKRVNVEAYALVFEWDDEIGGGFSFPCDKNGTLLLDKMPPAAQENLKKCQSGEYVTVARGIRDYSYTYPEFAQGRCSCGRIVELIDPMTNTCECGLEYNGGGQLLAPRSQWGDEFIVQPEEDYGLY
jgi:hypothetical protein